MCAGHVISLCTSLVLVVSSFSDKNIPERQRPTPDSSRTLETGSGLRRRNLRVLDPKCGGAGETHRVGRFIILPLMGLVSAHRRSDVIAPLPLAPPHRGPCGGVGVSLPQQP